MRVFDRMSTLVAPGQRLIGRGALAVFAISGALGTSLADDREVQSSQVAVAGEGDESTAPAMPNTKTPYHLRPDYIIEPPDILQIATARPYELQSRDRLCVTIGAATDQPARQLDLVVDADGAVDLGMPHGKVKIEGLDVDVATIALRKRLEPLAAPSQVAARLISTQGLAADKDKYLVSPDGGVDLGPYGHAVVGGMTVEAARASVRNQIATQRESAGRAIRN